MFWSEATEKSDGIYICQANMQLIHHTGIRLQLHNYNEGI